MSAGVACVAIQSYRRCRRSGNRLTSGVMHPTVFIADKPDGLRLESPLKIGANALLHPVQQCRIARICRIIRAAVLVSHQIIFVMRRGAELTRPF